MQDMQTDRARELTRWEASRRDIVRALPDSASSYDTPAKWLASAWRVVSDPAMAAAAPDALVGAMRQAAADGLMPHEGTLHVQPDGSVVWVPRWQALRVLLHRCMPGLYVRSGVVRPGDEFVLTRDQWGAITYLNHYREPDARDEPWTMAFATAGHPDHNFRKRYILLTRAEAERQAADHLCLPAPEDAESLAQRVLLVRIAEALPLETDWLPVRRFWSVARRFWVEA